MPRAIWSGAINFGLVTVPVALFSATREHTVHFNQFQRGTADRIRYRRVNERTGDEVEFDDIVKGYEVDDGEYVIVEPDELADIAPGRSRTLQISAFVSLDDIDPIFFHKTYWLAPGDETYAHSYWLLQKAMAETNRAAVATFVMRGKEYLAAIRADEGVLALQTLFFADEIRDRADLAEPPAKEITAKELTMAGTLIEAMSEPWEPEQYRDTYTDRVMKLIKDKQAGREVVAESAPEPTEVLDLMEALSRSVEATRGNRDKSTGGKGGKSTGTDKDRAGTAKDKTARGKADKDSKGGRGRAQPGLGELKKTELDDMARELGVRGRSKMTRPELEKAITEHRRAS